MNKEKVSASRSFLSRHRRDLIEWGVILAVILALYLTGLHTEVLGRMQQALLWTGLIQPDIELPAEEQVLAGYGMRLTPINEGDRAVRSLEAFRGKVIFLNFWATWCAPCIAEMPNIQALYDRMGGEEDLAFVMVSVDESPETAQVFMERKGFTFPVYHLAGGRPPVLSSGIVPTTYVIGRDGMIIARSEGMANYNTAAFRTFLRDRLER